MFSRKKFNQVEEEIIRAVGEALDDADRQKLAEQLALINKVQRHTDDKEVNLYMMKYGKVFTPSEKILFTTHPTEFKLASVRVLSSHPECSIRANVWVVKGRIFSIEFDKSPKSLKGTISIDSCEIVTAPSDRSNLSPASSLDSDLKAEELPKEYIELIRDETVNLNQWKILPPEAIYSVVNPENNMFVFAEKANLGVLSFFLGNEGIYYADFESHQIQRVNMPLEKFIQGN